MMKIEAASDKEAEVDPVFPEERQAVTPSLRVRDAAHIITGPRKAPGSSRAVVA